MAYKPCDFDREQYLELYEEIGSEEKNGFFYPDAELCEFNADAGDLAYELAHTRCRVAKLEAAIKLTLEENGHLADGNDCTLRRLVDVLMD